MKNILRPLISGIVVGTISAIVTNKMLKKSIKQQDKILKVTEKNKLKLTGIKNPLSEAIANTIQKSKT